MMSWKDKFPKENRYFETENGILYNFDCIEIMKEFPKESIDLIVTSPPYDNLRTYNNDIDKLWSFDLFKLVANNITKIIKQGGVTVWVVNDATIKGSETGSSFKQALYFKDNCGLNLHDTMIWKKPNFSNPSNNRYHQTFEYMFIFSKGKPKTFNPIKDRKNKYKQGSVGKNSTRLKNGEMKEIKKKYNTDYGMRHNVWEVITAGQENMGKSLPHPAMFPLKLVNDHILSWSNISDIILDPFIGSGTTAVACEKLNRKWIGIELSEEYCEITKQRIKGLYDKL
jgi:DNA modification methylase